MCVRAAAEKQAEKLSGSLWSHFEHNAFFVRPTVPGCAIEIAGAVQNQAGKRCGSVRAVEAPENLLCISAVASGDQLENSSVTVKTTSFRAAVNIPGCIESNSSERKSAVLEAAKAVEQGVCPWSILCRTQLVNGSIILVAATTRSTIKVSALVKRERP